MKPDLLGTLTRKNKHDAAQDARLNHLLFGDFNPTEWREGFEIWTGDAGMWELTDPNIPTFPFRNALVKFLLFPGDPVLESVRPQLSKLILTTKHRE